MPLIAFEGGEACGKTTQLELAARRLRAQGLTVITSREPGGTPLAESIRNLFKAKTPETVLPLTEVCLVAAARAQHMAQVITPALKKGHWVLLDRFYDSTLVYQHLVGGVELGWISHVHRPILDGLLPDLIVVLQGQHQRVLGRTDFEDRYDSAPDEMQRRLEQAWETMAQCPLPWPCGLLPRRAFLNALQPSEALAEQIARLLPTPSAD